MRKVLAGIFTQNMLYISLVKLSKCVHTAQEKAQVTTILRDLQLPIIWWALGTHNTTGIRNAHPDKQGSSGFTTLPRWTFVPQMCVNASLTFSTTALTRNHSTSAASISLPAFYVETSVFPFPIHTQNIFRDHYSIFLVKLFSRSSWHVYNS